MNLVLFDNNYRSGMLPLAFTRPQAAIRIGILTVKEKWEVWTKASASYLVDDVLSQKFATNIQEDNIFISASVLPNEELVHAVGQLEKGQALVKEGLLIAVRASEFSLQEAQANALEKCEVINFEGEFVLLDKIYKLIPHNQAQIKSDYKVLTRDRQSQAIDETVTVVGLNKNPELIHQIFIEEGAEVEYCSLNPKEGPIYIGKNAKIWEGAMMRGPIAIGESVHISMGAKILPGATIGPWSKVGGEVSNSVITGYSNKVHDGYLGDSVLGEWCNLGADTNTSNLKNDFAMVKLWDYSAGRFGKTGLQFCGLVMGDYSRCAINTAFNSGTVVGVGSNIFGSGFPRNFVPSFVIGGPQGYRINSLKAVINTGAKAMARRNVEMSEQDEQILEAVFEQTKQYRISLK
ncbi:glucose-1-phosphate thymidylyltransferase [Carboxylicivirga mesophila]|uniref:Glucose-1-phosphate thymidylyltransferase n=1 Tax=Carboxylicivirga mesophila TaxID=1166478 RepID=A0ABS5K6S4_9BACT|nr:putative sugar nucleotidyl transferase [Carboxylicivirga mesophila]MBS2210666.1 glucose-1-phosphate thymidylyltransferase [Carboxylicivirga mesophila]